MIDTLLCMSYHGESRDSVCEELYFGGFHLEVRYWASSKKLKLMYPMTTMGKVTMKQG